MNPDALADAIVDALRPLHERVKTLETRLAAVERKPHVKFCGVHAVAHAYDPGDAVTHSGGLWICKEPTTGTPGDGFAGWQLAVKRGTR